MIRCAEIIATGGRRYPDLAAWIAVGGWPVFTRNATASVDTSKTKVISFDTIDPALDLLREGKVHVLLGQKYFGWGSESVKLLRDLKNGQMPASKIIDSGVDIVTKDNVEAYAEQWKKMAGAIAMKISRANSSSWSPAARRGSCRRASRRRSDWPSPIRARPLPLTAVRLTGGPLKHAQDLDAKYLLSLEPDRMLAFYRKRAGLEPKAAGYTGWDNEGRQLTGHIAGHYLSAVSLMWAATGDARFKQRADYIVSELKVVQDKQRRRFCRRAAGREGSIRRSVEGQHPLGELRSQRAVVAVVHAAQDVRRTARRLSPHRQPDGARHRDQVRAVGRARISTPMDDATVQRMLATEFGGMNEMMADLYADTGDKSGSICRTSSSTRPCSIR